MSSPSSETTITYLRTVIVYPRIPDIVVSDNDTAVTGAKFSEFLERNCISGIMVPPYHPTSNSAAERVVQLVLNKLKRLYLVNFEER